VDALKHRHDFRSWIGEVKPFYFIDSAQYDLPIVRWTLMYWSRVTLAQEMKAAALMRRPDLVLQLRNGWAMGGVGEPDEGWIEAAQAVLDLALRMRLPHGRNRAWSKHLQLLQLVCAIVDHLGTATAMQTTDPAAEALQRHARRLLCSGKKFHGKHK
jgi:hypothetical protein